MSQDKFEDRIRESFDSMDGIDEAEAMARKEAVWESVSPKEKKKGGRYLLLLLLFGPLFLVAGWFLNRTDMPNGEPLRVKFKDSAVPMASSERLELEQLRAMLSSNSLERDSLLKANEALTVLARQNSIVPQSTVTTRFRTLTDTVYVKEIKVEQLIVEKIIRDTVLIEVPMIIENEPAMAEVKEKQVEKAEEKKSRTNRDSAPASIQFNFSETDQLDK